MLTFPAGLRDGVSCTLAHHLGYVDGTVHSVAKGDGTEHRLSLQLRLQEVKKTLQPRDGWMEWIMGYA